MNETQCPVCRFLLPSNWFSRFCVPCSRLMENQACQRIGVVMTPPRERELTNGAISESYTRR